MGARSVIRTNDTIRPSRFRRCLATACWCAVAWGAVFGEAWSQQHPNAAQAERFALELKPLLRHRCFSCHGALKQQANLRLDTVASILRGGDSGPAVVPGDADRSLMIQRVSATDLEQRMPPQHEGESLTPAQIASLRAWISAGSPAPVEDRPEADPREHWSFRPISRPTVPAVPQTTWGSNAIDRFVAHNHERLVLRRAGEADKLQLLRRLSLDLIGLPPSPDEVLSALSDDSTEWYERAVDRLLNDPRYGERWARHWMDIWRYSDWWGLGEELRNSQKQIWHWRDWIVESLNGDLPYDEMLRGMLAADELYPNDLDKLRASGFLARNYFLFNRNQWMDETVEHVAKGFLGLTINCAKCHDHKYDPFSQRDYYRMRAFFEPYHVRVDLRPGTADLATDGIPRAFDGLPELPTYRFIRGNENNPDKSEVIAPGIPSVLEFAPLHIAPVDLPLEAWQPERRAWVAAEHIAAAEQRVESQRRKLADSEEALRKAQTHQQAIIDRQRSEKVPAATLPKDIAPFHVRDTFSALDQSRWKLMGGDWEFGEGGLRQRKDGPTRSVVRLADAPPSDFDASMRVTIVGGSQWRSAGISFDVTQADANTEPATDDSEQNVYISAYAGGPKLQAAWHRSGQWQFPGEAMVSVPIELNREYRLRVQVRDQLINASLDGRPLIAWRTPLARREGAMQFIAFDAMLVVHEVQIESLDPGTVLRDPSASAADPNTVAGAEFAAVSAQLEAQTARAALAAAELELQSVRRRAEATQRAVPGPSNPGGKPIEPPMTETAPGAEAGEAALLAARAAVRAERELAAAKARQTLAESELKLHRAMPNQREAIEKEVAAERESVEASQRKVDEPGEQFTPLMGARWTPTRFFNSGKDDPAVTFHASSTGRRKALAEWITDRRHPLTARVAVNHVWMRHFGHPLVPTVFDFGRNGVAPQQMQLLDWLAAELIDHGWSMKHLHKMILLSATYRMASSLAQTQDNHENNSVDRDNVWLWRRSPSRLESQIIRDAVLDLAGILDVRRGGPPIPAAEQARSARRSLYFFHSNNDRNLFLTTFDEALVKECYRREQSIVPQQALALTNSSLILDAAPQIADRIASCLPDISGGGSARIDDASQEQAGDVAFVKMAFAVLLGRFPEEGEFAAVRQAMLDWQQSTDATAAADPRRFARTQLVWVLLNHHDFVSVR